MGAAQGRQRRAVAPAGIRQSGGIEGEITVQAINEIPIPEITEKNKPKVEKIETLVNQILAKKQQDVNTDISKETSAIDKIIYKLYQLTEEEIKLIEK